MRYLIKALTTNNRDLRTSLNVSIENRIKSGTYLFAVSDGFQRIATYQKLKFVKSQTIFIPSLHPDYYSGLTGYVMTR